MYVSMDHIKYYTYCFALPLYFVVFICEVYITFFTLVVVFLFLFFWLSTSYFYSINDIYYTFYSMTLSHTSVLIKQMVEIKMTLNLCMLLSSSGYFLLLQAHFNLQLISQQFFFSTPSLYSIYLKSTFIQTL